MSIEIRHLSKLYAGTPVVDDVSLAVEQGELFVLLGPSGSGKSTLLRAIAGLVSVDSGSILLGGRDVSNLPPREREVGFVFQHYALFRHMSVADNVEFALAVRGEKAAKRRQRREELLALVGLAGFGQRRPSQLSGGQQQRVAIARALAHQPPFLLLDEPFGALDAKIRIELRQTLRRVQRELGLTVVFVTHDQEEAFELADRIAVLHLGRLLEVGRPEELYLRPHHSFVATFLGAANLLVGESTEKGIRLGPSEIPLGTFATGAAAAGRRRRVQVMFRPEDIELAGSSGDLLSPHLAEAAVEEVSFVGANERLRLRLPSLGGVRQVAPALPFGATYLEVDAQRPLHERLRLPLKPGDKAALGLRRVHALADASLRFLWAGGDGGADLAAARLMRKMAEKVGAHLASFGGAWPLGEEASRPQADEGGKENDIAFLGASPGQVAEVFGRSIPRARHLLVVQQEARLPRSLLVAVAIGEPGKNDIAMAERLAWQLGADATVLTVLPEAAENRPLPEHVQRFLDTCRRALGVRGVDAKVRVRFGSPSREIPLELEEGSYDLLVMGTPLSDVSLRPVLDGLVGRLLEERLPVPLLLIRTLAEK
jgi:sulfate transport system ATP-binding protein